MSSTIKVSTRGVAKHARDIIVVQCHNDALAADQIIDRLMQRKTLFGRRPLYSTRTECIKDNLYPNSPLSRAFAPAPQLTRCETLLLAAHKCVDDHMSLDVDDLSSLGIGAGTDARQSLVQRVWHKPISDETKVEESQS
jgi:hypothetical protein